MLTMASLTELLKDHMEVSTQRKVFLTSFYLVFALLLYTYICSLIGLIVLGLVFWYTYSYIDESTAPTLDPSGKFVFITGCDSGFGLESAKTIRDLGFHVIAGCYDDNSNGAKELKARPWVKKVEVVSLDVTSDTSVQAAYKEVKDICGDQGLWAVINNAGINSIGPAELLPMSTYHFVSEVNLFGPIRVIKYCLPLLRQAEGRVVNVLSERAFNHKPFSTTYCMAKAGLDAYSTCLRREMVSRKVKVITVIPGEFGGSTAICNPKMNEAMKETVVTERTKMSLDDQETTYPMEEIDAMFQAEHIEEKNKTGVATLNPVVDAYVDAIIKVEPKLRYMVHGTGRQYLDALIILARLAPVLPANVYEVMEKILMRVLN